ncbi:HlyD family secretion protein [Chitinophaga skermanii]|uniref:HlyD family secretion protein n=1 Tax=Chitinophaga skermanii TaxID=331697 RepID=A0A327QSV9_9BACT|nr:efflux RND transporter periplasmic adaptor subunit [Chitinophaga skermanii]RAJ06493.1 HlyD family secretion protein [Chitinophaga skermanii]
MKKYKWLIIVLVAVLAIALVWFFFLRKPAQQVVFETEHPTRGSISNSVTATGSIQPVDTVSVGTQISGTVKAIFTDFNQTVKKGQLIAEIDKSLLQATVDQITANLTSAKDQLVYQTQNYNRQKQLFDVGAISRADYETATYSYNVAKASVASLQAQLRSAKQNLSFADIFSPIDGVVMYRNVSIGQTVASSFNTPTLFVIAKDLTKMQVQASVDEADIGNVQKGLQVTFTVDAYPEDVFKGSVKDIWLRPSISSNVVTYNTIIETANEDMKLKPGMTANITIYTKLVEDAVLISARALQFKPDSSMLGKTYNIIPGPPHPRKKENDTSSIKHASVWVKQDSNIVRKTITIGMNDETHVQVLNGLTTEDNVITDATLVSAKEAKGNQQVKSPFMPSRPRGNQRRN